MMTLADAIIAEDLRQVEMILAQGYSLNQVDEYGFTPLIEAAIADNNDIAKLLLAQGADVNLRDMTGSSALHWAAENNNLSLAKLLLARRADPNAYTLSGQPVLVMPLLRHQSPVKTLLLDQGANLEFAQDFINTKMLGHMFELVGTANIVSPNNQFVEVDFEGFFLEVSLGMIAESLNDFKHHFAARQMRRYGIVSETIVAVIQRAARLIKFQQYRTNLDRHRFEIKTLIEQEPLLIPVGYEGHAITFIKYGNIFVKCDRREASRLYDNIMIYQVGRPEVLTEKFIKALIYEKQTDGYINDILPIALDLQPIVELKIAAQVSGNCSWANVEAAIPTLHFLLSTQNADFRDNIPTYKSQALNYFQQWREWNRERALRFCIQSLNHVDSIRRVSKAEILAAIFFQCCNNTDIANRERVEMLLEILSRPEFEYILQNYIRIYAYEDQAEEGKNFLRLLRDFGYRV
jgi:hypothetical protein